MPYDRDMLLRRCALFRTRTLVEANQSRVTEIVQRRKKIGAWRRDQLPALMHLADEIRRVAASGPEAVLTGNEVREILGTRYYDRLGAEVSSTEPAPEIEPNDVALPSWLLELESVLTAETNAVVSGHTLEKAGVLRVIRLLPRLPEETSRGT